MTLPADLSAQVVALQAAVAAAYPVAQAGAPTVKTLQAQARVLVQAMDAAITTYDPSAIDTSTAAGVQAYIAAAETQTSIAGARGYVGRVLSNLDQVPA